MSRSTKYLLLAFAAICIAPCNGCVSRQQNGSAKFGAAIGEALGKAMFDPIFELAYGTNEFREAKKRWPKSYAELSDFLKQSDEQRYRALQAVKYDRVDFSETADGKLRINAEFTFASGGTGRIRDMEISPIDPHEMMIQASPKSTTTGP